MAQNAGFKQIKTITAVDIRASKPRRKQSRGGRLKDRQELDSTGGVVRISGIPKCLLKTNPYKKTRGQLSVKSEEKFLLVEDARVVA